MEVDIKLVNKLIEKSFGKGFRGNYEWHVIPVNRPKHMFKEKNEFGLIGKARLFREDKLIGSFRNKDGSSLNIDKNSIEGGEKYSSLYEKMTGKKPEINFYTSITIRKMETDSFSLNI
ncbi:hypothetical protein CMI39_03355 [Candidatus Pacearchaeota archaeon]|nr:hypothetical protein [Candidatus Pacearchaeota archaeon]